MARVVEHAGGERGIRGVLFEPLFRSFEGRDRAEQGFERAHAHRIDRAREVPFGGR
jgi:predicted TIM-barrel fold metal-dependent hydrolase